MRIFVDTASLYEIEKWDQHPWVSGFTTNPTLQKGATTLDGMTWAKQAVSLTDKPISIDGPVGICDLGEKVYRKVVMRPGEHASTLPRERINLTAVCSVSNVPPPNTWKKPDIISVFAGRIMDTGRSPQPIIDAAKASGAYVLWASVREPYNIVQAEQAGCDIVTVAPTILRKYFDWHGKPLEVVADETIAQFERDREGLW